MTWFLLAIVAVVAIWAISAIGNRGTEEEDPARSILNEQGLPRPFTRGDHVRNDEE